MGLFRYIAFFLLFYFLYKTITGMFRRPRGKDSYPEPEQYASPEKEKKIIQEDEGEYVDFEDVEK